MQLHIVVRCFASPRNDEDKHPPSRGAIAPEVCINLVPLENEGVGNAGCQRTRSRACIRSLKTVGSQQIHPVMLSALAKMDVTQVERLLRLLEVCIVRYLLIGGGNTGRFETTCAILARRIYSGEIKTATAAFEALKEVYPTDDEFRRTFEIKEEDSNPKAQYLCAG